MPEVSAEPETIRRLSAALVNQIAAGEVVVRPSAAVKELIENSLDAGASRIEVHVEEDARSFMVRDDGRGMSPADAELSIERHATSKIAEIEDLSRLATRGFRGEALAAISSVSRFELVTRRAGEDSGVRVALEGGGPARVQAAGAPEGTAVHVRDLFFNTPARMKFLRSAVVEWGHILKEISRQALTRPDVAFQVRWRGRPFLSLPGGQTLIERMRALAPTAETRELAEVEGELHGVRVWGAIGSPKATRRDRRHQYFFANGRPIVSRPLTFALQEAYRGLIMTQQFPVCALFVELPGESLDVNVHPAKEEVRFQNEALVAGAIHRSALEALRKADLVPRLEMPAPGAAFARGGGGAESFGARPGAGAAEAPPRIFVPGTAPFASGQIDSAEQTEAPQLPLYRASGSEVADADESSRGAAAQARASAREYADPAAREDASLIERIRHSAAPPRALAQVALTYILAEAPGLGLLLIDQHAAHEKIMYLKFMSRPEGRAVQPLLVPWTFEAELASAPVLEALAPALAAEGFEISHFGGGTFLIESVPAVFGRVDLGAFVRDLIDDVGAGDLKLELANLRHRIGARAACRAAVKAGDPLTLPEMQAMLDQVLETEEALRCPHGRPTMLLLGKEQLDRQFGRI